MGGTRVVAIGTEAGGDRLETGCMVALDMGWLCCNCMESLVGVGGTLVATRRGLSTPRPMVGRRGIDIWLKGRPGGVP